MPADLVGGRIVELAVAYPVEVASENLTVLVAQPELVVAEMAPVAVGT